jgi:hypothetical protein
MDEDARALIRQSARHEPTHAVRRPSNQYGFIFDVHTLPRA